MQKLFESTVLLAFVAGLLAATSVTAYVLLNPPRTWDSAPTYIVDQDGLASVVDEDRGVTATVDAIHSADAWNGLGLGTVIEARAGDTSGFLPGDGQPMLSFDDPLGVCTGSCVAATFTGYYSPRGDGSYRIFDADIMTNTTYDWSSLRETDGCSDEFFVEAVFVHETGHGLGLGHSGVDGATMAFSIAACDDEPATLAVDDREGLRFLYEFFRPQQPVCGLHGDPCLEDGECCQGRCRGLGGRKTCR